MNLYRFLKLIILLILISVMFTGCVPGDGHNNELNRAGFLWGIWHGWIAPVSLVLSFLKKGLRIYEVHNNGLWYDFGFYIAVISGFGGLSLFRKKKNDD